MPPPPPEVAELYVSLHELFEMAEESTEDTEPALRQEMAPLAAHALALAAEAGLAERHQAGIRALAAALPTAPFYQLEDDALRVRDALGADYRLPEPPATRPDAIEGARLYGEACAPCHGPSGVPLPEVLERLHPPPTNLRLLARQPATDPAWLYLAITYGVPTTPMPAFGESLSDEQRWQLVRYVSGLR